MIKYASVIILLLLITSVSSAQQKIDSVEQIKNEFESFEYKNVIMHADEMLSLKKNLSMEQRIQIYMMKGVSQYSLSDDNGAQKTFEEILKINPAYVLDSTKTSPKIISFFNLVKQAYNQNLAEKNNIQKIKTDTVFIPKIVHEPEQEFDMQQAMLRSILLPGLGHFYLHEYGKGFVLTALSAAALASSIYYIIDSNNKEKAYSNETNSVLIQQKYNSYNTSYKLKNISILAYAAIWLYSQADILLFHHQLDSANGTTSIVPQIDFNYSYSLRLNFNLAF